MNVTTIIWLIMSGLLTIAIVFGMVMFVTRRDFKIDLGGPTPEQARVKVAAATKPVADKADAEVKEVADADHAELARRAHQLASRK